MMSSEHGEKLAFEVNNAISKNDLDALIQLLDWSTIRDEDGNTPLHLSIILEKHEIFHYLLSLKEIDLEARDKTGQTPLILSLNLIEEYFAQELIKKGANIDVVDASNNTVLHLALHYKLFNVARFVIERGADLNALNNEERTPFHMAFLNDLEGTLEGIGMLMYYGADASICNNYGNIPFDLAVIYYPYKTAAFESLLYYSFDSHSKYQMSVDILSELLSIKSPLFDLVINYVSEIVFVKDSSLSSFLLFHIDVEVLKVLIEKFDNAVKKILSYPPDFLYKEFFIGDTSIKNWELLLQSHLASDVIENFGRYKIDWFIRRLNVSEMDVPLEVSEAFFIMLLTYGIEASETGIKEVYEKYGYCDLFRTLLHMDFEINKLTDSATSDIFPELFYDVNLDLEMFLKNLHIYSTSAIEELLGYYAHPKLKRFCKRRDKRLKDRAKDLPDVPLLVELARNASRKHLVGKYNITCYKDFYTLIKRLPISRTHEKILSFETKLYR